MNGLGRNLNDNDQCTTPYTEYYLVVKLLSPHDRAVEGPTRRRLKATSTSTAMSPSAHGVRTAIWNLKVGTTCLLT